ncbi:MAG: hypothetical protein HKN07_07280 [Acidimicrobiia bacterium]|nr:hypothetical protein [Acidimicrobiia bacterium]RZV42817.1 MAG: hypothetical protein EX269_14290 [Acidimicrobiales bacterium]
MGSDDAGPQPTSRDRRSVDPADELLFWGSPQGAVFRRSAATAWADAAINDGDTVETAREAAERSADFYTPDGNSTE